MEQFLFNLAAPVLTGVLGLMSWFLKGSIDRVATLEEKYNTLHDHYVKKMDFVRFEDKIEKQLNRIEAKIDKQVLKDL